jgi:hypothetical protein
VAPITELKQPEFKEEKPPPPQNEGEFSVSIFFCEHFERISQNYVFSEAVS